MFKIIRELSRNVSSPGGREGLFSGRASKKKEVEFKKPSFRGGGLTQRDRRALMIRISQELAKKKSPR